MCCLCCVTHTTRLVWLSMQVRISRKRVLESAAKVFEMYGTSRAVLEIEYFGEVGPSFPHFLLTHAMLGQGGLGLYQMTGWLSVYFFCAVH